jgi:hypothetical protein
MPAGGSTRCPDCQATLKLKSAAMVGKTVPCPKCGQPFVITIAAGAKVAPTPREPSSEADDEFSFVDVDLGESSRATAPAPVRGKVKKPRREAEAPEEDAQPLLIGKVFRALICVNAHLAIALVVLENLWELFGILTHWSEFQNQMVTWRFGRAQLARPVLLIASALYVWWQAVVPRDIGMRHLVSFFGGSYLFLFGAVAFLIALMANSLYDRPIYVVDGGWCISGSRCWRSPAGASRRRRLCSWRNGSRPKGGTATR